MSRRSKIKQLDPVVRETVDRLLNAGVTLDDILAKLNELGVTDVSRSSLGRYKLEIDKVGEKLRRTREISNSLIEKLGQASEGKQGRLLAEVLQSIIFDLLCAGGGGEGDSADRAVTLDPMSVMQIAKALNLIAGAQKTEASTILGVRKELAAEAEKKLKKLEAEGAEPGAAKRGIDPETLRRVREEIYGLPAQSEAAKPLST